MSIKDHKPIYIIGNHMPATKVIKFWFEDIESRQQFSKDPKFDQVVRTKFTKTYHLAVQGLLYAWREHSLYALAEIIVLDQLLRNMFRGTPKAFQADTIALILAQEAIRKKFDMELDNSKKSFFYMPFMHSESKEMHDIALFLFDQPGLEDGFNFEVKHKAIIDHFGRYPQRNEMLKRKSTDDELDFLSQPGSLF